MAFQSYHAASTEQTTHEYVHQRLSLSLSFLSPCFQCKMIIYFHTYDTNISFLSLSRSLFLSLALSFSLLTTVNVEVFSPASASAFSRYSKHVFTVQSF